MVITWTDLVGTMMSSVTRIVDMVSAMLVAFVSISLIVSSIMIAVITYISVLERKKEIGILRAIGASKHKHLERLQCGDRDRGSGGRRDGRCDNVAAHDTRQRHSGGSLRRFTTSFGCRRSMRLCLSASACCSPSSPASFRPRRPRAAIPWRRSVASSRGFGASRYCLK